MGCSHVFGHPCTRKHLSKFYPQLDLSILFKAGLKISGSILFKERLPM